MTLCPLIALFASGIALAAADSTVPYDAEAQRWLFDAQGIVSRNDVIYATPSVQPWEAMPVGGGDLSAMVRCDGSLHLHLSKSDAWGFQAPADAGLGTRFFNNVSPGHIELDFGKNAREKAAESFRQRLDLYHGRIVIHLGRAQAGARMDIWGHPTRKVLVVEIIDPHRVLDPAKITLSEWRATMEAGCSGETLHAREVHARPARPHLASTGMEDYFDAGHDPMLGRGTAVALAAGLLSPERCSAQGMTATMVLPAKRPPSYHLIVAAAVTASGDPLAAAKRELDDALKIPLATLKAEHQAWWRDYWSKSFLRIGSPDKTADRLCAAYHVHLYTLGCVNRGPVPAKWDGGAGLMRGDERTWGLSEWVQEIRFTYVPLYVANRLEMARGLTRHYSNMRPYLAEQTKRMWGIPGLWIPETVLPWGHAEDFVFRDDGHRKLRPRDPKTTPSGRFDRYNPYVGYLFTAGLEICHHYLAYYRYSGDETFLRDEAYPVIRGVCQFTSGLLRKERDGLYHLDPANALETWWMVRDPADTLDGIRAIFPQFIALSERCGRDAELRSQCARILAALPEPSLGLWTADGRIDPNVRVYAPAAAKDNERRSSNSENPALYRVYPFGLSGIGSSDYELARNTFERRIFGITNSWSMDAIWAARLGLRDEACRLLGEHAARYNRFRYGGWDSSNSSVFPGGLSVAPYLDGAGNSAFALQEVLLQCHQGLIRLTPSVAASWSGIFRLRAEGGFLVAADYRSGTPRFVEIKSLLGKDCRIANPWSGRCRVRQRANTVIESAERTVSFPTRAGALYVLEPTEAPLAGYRVSPIQDKPNDRPGMPGRD